MRQLAGPGCVPGHLMNGHSLRTVIPGSQPFNPRSTPDQGKHQSGEGQVVGDDHRHRTPRSRADESGLADEGIGDEEEGGPAIAAPPPAPIAVATIAPIAATYASTGTTSDRRPSRTKALRNRVVSRAAITATSAMPSASWLLDARCSARPTLKHSCATRNDARPGTNASLGSMRNTSPNKQKASATQNQTRVSACRGSSASAVARNATAAAGLHAYWSAGRSAATAHQSATANAAAKPKQVHESAFSAPAGRSCARRR